MDNGSETYSIVNLTQKLLDAIADLDWETYLSLVDEKLTCIESETGNSIVEGLEYHKTFFLMPKDEKFLRKENILQPITKLVGDCAIITFKRVTQVINLVDKTSTTIISAETRVW